MKIELSEVTDYTVWSAHKAVMRGQFIRQSAYIKRHHQTTLLECHKQIAINTAQNKKTPTAALADKLRGLYQDLNELNAQKTQYFLHRLRATTYHHSGKATKYLANRLRTKQAANRIPHLIGHTGEKLMNPMDIVQEFAHFYKQLYNLNTSGGATAPDTQSIRSYLQGVELPKLDQESTQALGVRLNHRTLTVLKEKHHFEWRTGTIKYLGLTFTKNPTETFSANYVKVRGECRQLMKKWGTLFLTWTERVATIKISILPRLQYLFRNLPIQVPASYLREAQRDMNRFVWGGQKARVKGTLLRAPARKGGLALPDIKSYYQAATLAALLPHFTTTTTLQWVHLEKLAVKPFDIPTLLWLPNRFRPEVTQMPAQIKIALNTWDKIRHKHPITGHPAPYYNVLYPNHQRKALDDKRGHSPVPNVHTEHTKNFSRLTGRISCTSGLSIFPYATKLVSA
ncbi:Hypothetical predicted protein [Pelobates cultripes]|uniref:Reverse transcriptase n=1 Tax=Pelobates cultripes TaxID=61616 RepID=A0AAD1RQP7_PELCU|nr:Hypothetical predicted protein [Pelobates cultripes]